MLIGAVMTSLFIVLAMYLLLGWLTAKGTLMFYYKARYKDLLGHRQDSVCACFWFWWLLWIACFVSSIVFICNRYLTPVLTKLWNKIL